uniref:Purine and other phosphorylases, family 1 n=1 Tax=Solibacter usitatus (strain Ellin6076) TaxID=234267 RepID=Q029M0_SOLUE
MKLLFVAADAMEFPGILARSRESRRPAVAVDWARLATLNGHAVMLAANGAGAKRAAAAVDAALEKFDADAVISTGFCGALDPELAVAEVVVGTEVAADGRRFPAAVPSSPRRHHTGVVCSIGRVAQTAEEKRVLRASGGAVVEMEAGGVAERAGAKGIKFYCIRVVTDLAGEDMANDFNLALRPDGHFATMSILRRALRDPLVRVPELIRLRNRCVRASRSLGEFIADCRY